VYTLSLEGAGEGILALVNVTKRVQIEGKGWRFCEVVVAANGKIKPNVVLIDGQEQVHRQANTNPNGPQGCNRRGFRLR